MNEELIYILVASIWVLLGWSSLIVIYYNEDELTLTDLLLCIPLGAMLGVAWLGIIAHALLGDTTVLKRKEHTYKFKD
jgi:hypothetical protein